MTRLASGALGAPGTPSVEHLDDLEPTDGRDPSREADGDVVGMQQGDAEQGPRDGNVEHSPPPNPICRAMLRAVSGRIGRHMSDASPGGGG